MCVHELIHNHAKVRPDGLAVVAADARLTYRELDARADALASLLRSLGVSQGAIVALCMHRSAALIVAALGVLKAGAVYTPLDPADPASRLTALLEDSATRLVLTQAGVSESLPSGNWETVVLGDDGSLPGGDVEAAPLIPVQPADLAYIIFTSGSTGRPKGVQITHGNLLNLIHWHIRAFDVSSLDRATMQSSPGFDAAVWEVWPYLVAGASIHVIDDSVRMNPELLRNWILDTGITISFLPTVLAEAMTALQWPPDTSLRYLLTGADVLHRYPRPDLPFALVNNYGPTECTVVATSGRILPDSKSGLLPSIGRPIDNVRTYIVDERLNRVPEGASGELLIGGANVGMGYLNRPELTAQKFLSDPFSEGSRVYRTGDLVRMLPDGQIMFLGRVDDQVKIRGYRIEPGEITAVLNRHAAVENAFVTARSDDSAEPRLVAYVVIRPDVSIPNASELQSFLADKLPAYMVPSAFVRLDDLPLTGHGKVDRTALPVPGPTNVLNDGPFEPPQSEVETWLAELLTQLLRVPHLSRDDNFFRLGGHSLMGAQLIAKIQDRFGIELSLRSLFDHPTIRGIAAEIDNLIRAQLNAMTDDDARRMLESLSGGVPI